MYFHSLQFLAFLALALMFYWMGTPTGPVLEEEKDPGNSADGAGESETRSSGGIRSFIPGTVN